MSILFEAFFGPFLGLKFLPARRSREDKIANTVSQSNPVNFDSLSAGQRALHDACHQHPNKEFLVTHLNEIMAALGGCFQPDAVSISVPDGDDWKIVKSFKCRSNDVLDGKHIETYKHYLKIVTNSQKETSELQIRALNSNEICAVLDNSSKVQTERGSFGFQETYEGTSIDRSGKPVPTLWTAFYDA